MSGLLWKFALAATLPVDLPDDQLAELIPWPVYCSPKVDGFRCGIQRGVLMGRNGLPIPNIGAQAKWGSYKAWEGLDGELTDGPPNALDVFNRTSRVVKKATADASNLRFNVFDISSVLNLPDRVGLLKRMKSQGLSIVPQTLVYNLPQLLSYEQAQLARGYEGVMMRRRNQGAYFDKGTKDNRSTLAEFLLVKLKRFEYGEAKIMAVHALETNKNEERVAGGRRSSKKAGMQRVAGSFGSATLKDIETSHVFSVKIAEQAMQRWYGWRDSDNWLERVIRYKHQPVGRKDAPRFPTATFAELL